jgi:hypothetical protein
MRFINRLVFVFMPHEVQCTVFGRTAQQLALIPRHEPHVPGILLLVTARWRDHY